MSDRLPGTAELASWREFLRAHARLTRQLEADLIREQQLSLASYDVLVQLAEAPGHRLRMTDLADALLLSRSGVTRLISRLEDVGSVVRYPSADDGRGVVAELTECGRDQLRGASDTHLAGITRYFVSRLSPTQLELLREICSALAGPSPGPSRPAEIHQKSGIAAPDSPAPQNSSAARKSSAAQPDSAYPDQAEPISLS